MWVLTCSTLSTSAQRASISWIARFYMHMLAGMDVPILPDQMDDLKEIGSKAAARNATLSIN